MLTVNYKKLEQQFYEHLVPNGVSCLALALLMRQPHGRSSLFTETKPAQLLPRVPQLINSFLLWTPETNLQPVKASHNVVVHSKPLLSCSEPLSTQMQQGCSGSPRSPPGAAPPSGWAEPSETDCQRQGTLCRPCTNCISQSSVAWPHVPSLPWGNSKSCFLGATSFLLFSSQFWNGCFKILLYSGFFLPHYPCSEEQMNCFDLNLEAHAFSFLQTPGWSISSPESLIKL